jgi:hypothetical protein
MNEKERLWMTAVMPRRRCAESTVGRIGKALQEASRIFRIAVFLHSAQDFPTILRLYGLENTSQEARANEEQEVFET